MDKILRDVQQALNASELPWAIDFEDLGVHARLNTSAPSYEAFIRHAALAVRGAFVEFQAKYSEQLTALSAEIKRLDEAKLPLAFHLDGSFFIGLPLAYQDKIVEVIGSCEWRGYKMVETKYGTRGVLDAIKAVKEIFLLENL